MFLLLSVFVLVSVAIPEVAADPCEDLEQCIYVNSHGSPNGTWYWLFDEARETTQNESLWLDYINRMCNNWRERLSCSLPEPRHACWDVTLRRKAHYERRKTEWLCHFSRGRRFYERIYTEAPSHCMGNTTLTREAMAYRDFCLARQGLTVHTYNECNASCDASTRARDCYREWVGEQCGDLFRWLTDVEWSRRNEKYFPGCNPRRFEWPNEV